MDTGTGCPTIQRSWLITKSLKPFIAPFYLGLKRVTDKLALSPRKEAGMPSLIVTSQLENCTDAKDVCVWTLKMQTVLSEAIASDDGLIGCVARDLEAVRERDPACQTYLQCFLYFKGFMAIQTHRLAHALLKEGRDLVAFHLQNRSSELFGVDINPAAKIGCGVMLDHATGFVVGETAVIGDDCSILQGVTLGGTGKSDEDRHPKIGNRVLIGANASVLGNIKIGDGAKIAAGSVVLKPVEANCTVAGVPAKPVGGPCCGNPASSMDQTL